MACYDGPTMPAARAFWRARKNPASVRVGYQQHSLLDSGCCALWAQALNCNREEPRKFAYFAMLHADVQPPDFWLDFLIDEMEARGLDVLSAVVPIKDPHGLTSTAIGDPDLNQFWRCKYRLTLKEVYGLPETFTAADCGRPGWPLLINTGCFVCRFDEGWTRHASFSSNTRIVFDEAKGRYVVEAEPEDWHFARDCHRLGLKVGATRKLALSHRGFTDFVNARPWGDFAYDEQYLDAPEAMPAAGAFRFPCDVEGWLGEEEGRELYRLAEGKDVLEIGSYCGKSTICLAQSAVRVDCVDPFDGRDTPRPRLTLGEFQHNLRRHGVFDNVQTYVGTVRDVYPQLSGDYGLVFIDGAHDYESVCADADLACRLLKPGGLVAFHDFREHASDYDGRWDPGVTRAVHELMRHCDWELLSVTGTVAVLRPPAKVAELLEVNCG